MNLKKPHLPPFYINFCEQIFYRVCLEAVALCPHSHQLIRSSKRLCPPTSPEIGNSPSDPLSVYLHSLLLISAFPTQPITLQGL